MPTKTRNCKRSKKLPFLTANMFIVLTLVTCCQASNFNEENATITSRQEVEFIKDQKLGIEATKKVWSAFGYVPKNSEGYFGDNLDDNSSEDSDSAEESEMESQNSDEVSISNEDKKEGVEVYIDWDYYTKYEFPMNEFKEKKLQTFKSKVEENIKHCMPHFLESENFEGKEDVYIGDSKVQTRGEGLFTNKLFRVGDVIGLFNGKMYSEKEEKFIAENRHPYLMAFHVTHSLTGKTTKVYIDPYKKSAKTNDCRSNICEPITKTDQKKQNLMWLEFDYLGFPYIAEVIIAKVNIHEELLTYYGEEYECEKPNITASTTVLYTSPTKLSLLGSSKKIKVALEKEKDTNERKNLKRKHKTAERDNNDQENSKLTQLQNLKKKNTIQLQPTEELYLEAENLNKKYKKYNPGKKCSFFNNISFDQVRNSYKCRFLMPQSEVYQRRMFNLVTNKHFGRCVIFCRAIYELNKNYYQSLQAPKNIAQLKEKSEFENKVESFNKKYNYKNNMWQNNNNTGVKFKKAEAHKFHHIFYHVGLNSFRCTYNCRPINRNKHIVTNQNLAHCIVQAQELVKQDIDHTEYPMVPDNLGQRKPNVDEEAYIQQESDKLQKKYAGLNVFEQAELYHRITWDGKSFKACYSTTVVTCKKNLFHCLFECQKRLKETPEKYARIPDYIISTMGQLKKKSEADQKEYETLMKYLADNSEINNEKL